MGCDIVVSGVMLWGVWCYFFMRATFSLHTLVGSKHDLSYSFCYTPAM